MLAEIREIDINVNLIQPPNNIQVRRFADLILPSANLVFVRGWAAFLAPEHIRVDVGGVTAGPKATVLPHHSAFLRHDSRNHETDIILQDESQGREFQSREYVQSSHHAMPRKLSSKVSTGVAFKPPEQTGGKTSYIPEFLQDSSSPQAPLIVM